MRFPDAAYFIIASRLRPGLDGGYTVATMRRALDFERVGVSPTILTVELAPDVDELRREFIALGLATPGTVMRNLYADLRANPGALRAFAAAAGSAAQAPSAAGTELVGVTTSDARGPWRITTSAADRETLFTTYLDASGRPLLRIPYVSGRADWHRADIRIDVLDERGELAGQLGGFGALYRFWVESVLAESGADRALVVCEAKQVGELLAVGDRSYTLVHTVHNAHTAPPHAWDSPIDELWGGWFDVIDDMDAVLWLTETQRADAVRRFGEHANWIVVPHPAEPVQSSAVQSPRDPSRVVMLARFVPQKRVEDAIEAWPALRARVPAARLDIYGDGPQRIELESRIAALGLGDSVTFHGHVDGAVNELTTAAALLLTSRHEGQPLVVLEALSRGCPVIAYDVHYGPADMIEDGRSGILVEAGNREALVDALAGVVGNSARIAELSAGAADWAAAHGSEVSMQIMADLFTQLLSFPRRLSAAPVGAASPHTN